MALGPEPNLNRATGIVAKGNLTVGAPCTSCSGQGTQGSNLQQHQNYGASNSSTRAS